MCADARDPVIAAMPRNRFWVIDLARSGLFDGYATVGGDSMADQLLAIGELRKSPAIACDVRLSNQGLRHCTAAVRLSARAGAVWHVWEGGKEAETAAAMAEREGRAIRAFIAHAAGPTEDYEAVLAAACRLKRAVSSAPGTQDRCALEGA